LLHVLHLLKSEYDIWLVVAHVDHLLRPESGEDAQFVRQMARALGLEVRIKRVDVHGAASAMAMSLEAAGRRLRYEFLEQVRAAEGAAAVATGHHRDDELETFFLRLLHGTTLTGLGGIPPVRDRVIRPLIRASRPDILSFLQEKGVPCRIDCTNLGVDTDRNFIRNSLFPAIRRRFTNFHSPMQRTIEMVRQEEALLAELSAQLYQSAVSEQENELIVSVPAVLKAHGVVAARAVLQALYRLSGPEIRWTSAHVDAVLRIVRGHNPSATAHLAGGVMLVREYDSVRLRVGHLEHCEPFSIEVSGPGTIEVPGTRMKVAFETVEVRGDKPSLPTSEQSAHFDADGISFPVHLRSPVPGDKFRPWGLDGTRKIKRVLIDHKISVRWRKKIPLLVKDTEILWIPGIRRGQAAAVRPGTRRVLSVKVVEWGELRRAFRNPEENMDRLEPMRMF
jgi:tRNA(Ile)-lysidine synthase